jgi:glutaredoxin-related protein
LLSPVVLNLSCASERAVPVFPDAWSHFFLLVLQIVGGSDIILEMYQTGELQEMIEIAAAS